MHPNSSVGDRSAFVAKVGGIGFLALAAFNGLGMPLFRFALVGNGPQIVMKEGVLHNRRIHCRM
jgi:hypothetical protein